MNPTLKQLRAFAAVARTRSLAEASARLHISQPALSVAIRNLEESLGGALFSRDSRQLALTPEGREFLGRAEQLLNNWDHSMEAMQQRFRLEQGQLNLAVIPAFALNRLPGLLAEFHSRHPSINIVIEDIVMERVQRAVQEGRAEIGITFRPADLGGLEFQGFARDRFIAVVPAAHPLAGKSAVTWRELAGEPFIAMNRGSAVRRWTDGAMAEIGYSGRLLCEANQLSTIGQLVATGMGISVVPELCRPQMRDYGLPCLALQAPDIEQEVGVLLRSHGALSAPARALLQLVTAP
ncbi:LysR family transcriptional regulator [Microbulbifer yueqingensis]|uniref:LysR family transcriptional regulator, carnitine catabolism transcriptional activator n=1 Tax=Microbulbifer yueqingensis TaxID=658219 RepID=A0A1G8UNY1_9GAMM|nr:LysR family transcriptional regulator [Microbulbifer yueqingensis]SDJ55586.1 LysR family transcriptional regulator, carnitine catabolism transcriptional activator [Microbulbifer yueqingensis]